MTGARAATAGITLLELVIAILVLSIGTIAAFRGMDQARRVIGDEPARLFAHQVALNRAEALQLTGATLGRNLPETADYGPVTWTVTVTEARTLAGFVEETITVSAPGLPGARLVAYVPPEARP